MVGALGAVVAGVTIFGLACVTVATAIPILAWHEARRMFRDGYRLGLERARQCAIYPPQSAFHYEARAAHDDVFQRISTLIEEDNP